MIKHWTIKLHYSFIRSLVDHGHNSLNWKFLYPCFEATRATNRVLKYSFIVEELKYSLWKNWKDRKSFLTHYIFPVSNRSYGRINVFIDLEVFIFKQYQVIARSTPFPKHSMKSVQVKISINPVISVCEYIYTLSVCVCLVLQKRQEGAKKRADNFFLKIMWNLYLWTLSLLCEV